MISFLFLPFQIIPDTGKINFNNIFLKYMYLTCLVDWINLFRLTTLCNENAMLVLGSSFQNVWILIMELAVPVLLMERTNPTQTHLPHPAV